MKYYFLISHLIRKMGVGYLLFRTLYEVKRKLGWWIIFTPTSPPSKRLITLDAWKKDNPDFFFSQKSVLKIPKFREESLNNDTEAILKNEWPMFNGEFRHIEFDHWLKNPDSGYQYPLKHWSSIRDLDPYQGDIKYVWERARFCWASILLRHDYHFGRDHSGFLFAAIESFIDNNPINLGPHYRCSQEISLRLMNWLFILYYYKESNALTSSLFEKIFHSIYWQIQHVYRLISFSRKAVRNNHAISECLMIYTAGLLFPFFPKSQSWKARGKKWFEEEINRQIYDDGTYCMYSSNYHRVVIQLLTWAIQLSRIHNEDLDTSVRERAWLSIRFLVQCQDRRTGFLPNFGHNDGSLFFGFSHCNFRDFRPQIDALARAIGKKIYDNEFEEHYWFGIQNSTSAKPNPPKPGSLYFNKGGYWLLNEGDAITFLRAGNHLSRPSQADNLHLDLWVKGLNILRDNGSYKYNDPESLKFSSTEAHNTVNIPGENQMKKGPRFIWLNWSQMINNQLEESDEYWAFEGIIRAFQHLDKTITHWRKVTKYKTRSIWLIEDKLNSVHALEVHQRWHPDPNAIPYLNFSVKINGTKQHLHWDETWMSNTYGHKKRSKSLYVKAKTNELIQTRIVCEYS